MESINPVLLQMAENLDEQVTSSEEPSPTEKQAEGMLPGDPAAGMPPAGMPPGGDPAMAAMLGGVDPAQMGGAAPPPAVPAPGAAPGAAGVKLKPEQMALDFRLHNIQQQLATIMNAMGLSHSPESMITPPGAPAPSPDATPEPSPPADPTAAAPAASSAISPVAPMPGAFPEGEAPMKTAMQAHDDAIARLLDEHEAATAPERVGTPFSQQQPVTTNAAAAAALLRQRAL